MSTFDLVSPLSGPVSPPTTTASSLTAVQLFGVVVFAGFASVLMLLGVLFLAVDGSAQPGLAVPAAGVAPGQDPSLDVVANRFGATTDRVVPAGG
jgi:hypothetical protein